MGCDSTCGIYSIINTATSDYVSQSSLSLSSSSSSFLFYNLCQIIILKCTFHNQHKLTILHACFVLSFMAVQDYFTHFQPGQSGRWANNLTTYKPKNMASLTCSPSSTNLQQNVKRVWMQQQGLRSYH